MTYFKLSQDNRMPYGVLMTKLNEVDGYYESKSGNISALSRAIVTNVNSSKVNFYPDILDRQIFMIKGGVKAVFDIFLQDIEYKHCCYIDLPYERNELYYIPQLDLSKSTEKRHIFGISKQMELDVIVSLEVVEAILRTNPIGIRITPINI